jgi:hypothetical protein
MFGHDENQSSQDQSQSHNPAAASAPVFGPIQNNPPADNGASPAPHNNDFTGSATDSAASPAASTKDDLSSIKHEALQQLSPLVSHLDQTPEEKFHTTMMMIQASDDQSLIKEAYESAKQITDEKARAQALLDIVNEINYFTQQHNS